MAICVTLKVCEGVDVDDEATAVVPDGRVA